MNQLQHLIQQQELTSLSLLLQQSLKGINTQSTYSTLKNIQTKPQSYLYFLTLLISPNFEEPLRELSGINLKNMLKRNIESLPEHIITIIKRVLFEQYDYQQGRVLKVIGLVMGAIVEKIKFEEETLGFLLKKASEGNVFAIESLKRIVQDFRFDSENMSMIQSQQFAQLSKQLVGILLIQCQSENKRYAIECFNMMIYPMPVSLVPTLKQFVQILKTQIVTNQDPQVLLAVMEGFEAIVSTRKDLIDTEIIQLVATKTFTDPKICKVEVNFWIEALDSDSEELIQPVLNYILPKFILGLVLTNEDISNIMETASKNLVEDDEEMDTLDVEDNQEDIAKGGDYTLRKRCGLIIRKLSFNFSDVLWDLSKKYVEELLATNEWAKHQLAILYIGLLAENCSEIFREFIGDILKLVNNTLNNAGEHHLLKSTCLWTLAQNTSALVAVAQEEKGILNNYLNLILNGMRDEHNNVREASCNSLSNLIEEVKEHIFPWFDTICQVTTPALFAYRGNSLNLLLQLYATLSENIKKQNYSKKVLDQLLIPLCKKWAEIPKESEDNWQVIECLVSVCEMGREYLGTYTIQLYSRAIQLFDPKNKQIFCRVADLIETLVKGSLPDQQAEIGKSGIIEKTLELMVGSDHDVKQSCYSLLSDIVENIGVPQCDQVMGYVFTSINNKRESEINNGLHCMLEIMIKYPDMKSHLNELVATAAERLLTKKLEAHYKLNYSKIIGAVAFYHPEVVAPYLKTIFVSFCLAMKASNQHTGKYHLAAAGLFKLIQIKGQDIFEEFKYFADLCVCMKSTPLENQTTFTQILKQYRQSVGTDGWNRFLGDPYFLPAAVHKIQNLTNS